MTTTDTVQIKRAGNLLEISDAHAMVPILRDVLCYWHKAMKQQGRKRTFGTERISMYSVEHGNMYVLAGYLHRIYQECAKHGIGIEYTYINPPEYPQPDFANLHRVIPDMEMLYGQQDVLAHMVASDRGTFKAPTGYGKSYLARALCALYPTATVAICGPAADIVTSTYERLYEILPLDVGRIGGGYNDPNRVTACTAQSLHKLPLDNLDIFIFDEVHQAPAPTFQEAIGKIRRPKMFGFSANLEGRGDGADMVIEGLFGPKLFEVTYQKAVEHNIVLPMDVHLLSFSSLARVCESSNYDNAISKRRWYYWRNHARNKAFADFINNELEAHTCRPDPQILVLVDTLEHALFMKRLLPDFQLVYASSDLERLNQLQSRDLFNPDTDTVDKKKRTKLRKEFEADRVKRVIATSCWGTGVDFPALDALVIAAGPSSEIVTTQWPGRASRIHRGGDKQKGIVVDMEDKNDPWAFNRFKRRYNVYKEKGWNIISNQRELSYEAGH